MDISLLGASRDDELGAALAAEVSLSSFGGHLKDLRFRVIGLLYPRGALESIGIRRGKRQQKGWASGRGFRISNRLGDGRFQMRALWES